MIQGALQQGLSGLMQDAEGWTVASQFLATEGASAETGQAGERLSRIVYVSSGGDDSAASRNPHGRAYYLPSDPEIGSDPTQPRGSVRAYATFGAAIKAVRLSADARAADTPRYPEWILFQRGGRYDLDGIPLTINVSQGGPGPARRRVYVAYGETSQSRPQLYSSKALASSIPLWGERGGSNVAIMSLDFASGNLSGVDFKFGAKDVLVEDNLFRSMGAAQSGSANLVFRRNVAHGAHRSTGHVQGLYLQISGKALLEQNVFDMNGYVEDPFDPSTWTASANSKLTTGDMPEGTGLQPTRTWFSRNLYLSSYEELLLVRNIISRGGGGGSVQMRIGGVAEENVFLFNHSALQVGHDQSDRSKLMNAKVSRNLVLHDDLLLPPGGYGGGLTVAVGSEEQALVNDNVVAHFHDRKVNSQSMIGLGGISAYLDRPPERAKEIRVLDNAIVATRSLPISIQSPAASDGVAGAVIESNSILRMTGAGAAVLGTQEFNGLLVGSRSGSGNRYMTPGWQSYPEWKARGLDRFSTMFSSAGEVAAAAGWRYPEERQGAGGWTRDIVSYMVAIDPSFQPNDQVSVDAGVPVQKQRADAPKVMDTLTRMGMSVDAARLSARRYSAFLAFIERAKANRKGSWNYQYTSDALNNYIRDGFGKSAITALGAASGSD
jgi:hypothetical protein